MVQLVERETEREQALQVAARQSTRQPLCAQRRDLAVVSLECGSERLDWRRCVPRCERTCSRPQKIAGARADARECAGETRCDHLRQRRDNGAADDDEVMA